MSIYKKPEERKKRPQFVYKPITRGLLDYNNIEVEMDKSSYYGYRVYKWSNNERKELNILECADHYKYGGYRVSIRVNFWGYRTEEDTQKACVSLALAAIVYAWYRGDIPAGMVIDHIDENPFNNCLDNLQMITRSENTSRSSKGQNQHTKAKKYQDRVNPYEQR